MVCLQMSSEKKKIMKIDWNRKKSYPAIKFANSGWEFPCTRTTSDDGNDSMAPDFSFFNGSKLPNLRNETKKKKFSQLKIAMHRMQIKREKKNIIC